MSTTNLQMPDGTKLFLVNDDDSRLEVKSLLSLGGNIGSQGAMKQVQTLDSVQDFYVPSKRFNGGERDLVFQHDPSDPGQKQLREDAKAQRTRKMVVQMPMVPEAEEWSFSLALAGWQLKEPEVDNPFELIVKGGINADFGIKKAA